MTQLSQTEIPIYSSFGNDPDYRQLVVFFVEELSHLAADMLEKAKASDWEGLRRAAHQLKGAGGSYGFAPLTPAAARVENAIMAKAPEEEILEAVHVVADLCLRARAGQPVA